MKILVVASEVTPFAKTGGLADVAAALPKELRRMGHDVRVIMPFYGCVAASGQTIRKARKSVEVEVGGALYKGFLRQASLGEVPLYLVEQRELFGRDHLYGTAEGDDPDNPRRFAFFCRSVLQFLKRMDFRPDVIHCHDWQTALIPIILRHELGDDPFFAPAATVFTIHNLAYQGIHPRPALAEMGLSPALFTMEGVEYFGRVNLMKGAILSATVITTVSPTYCREIRTPEQGCGLEGVLAERSGDLHGILNGLDTDEWNPATDRRIVRTYSSRALAGKGGDKHELQRELGLPLAATVPLIGMVGRIVEQKGIELVAALLPRFAAEELQLVILGTGDARYMELLDRFRRRGVANISINLGFRDPLAPRIYAGSDMFLMPSRFEPCGLSQLIALRYGAVPIVRRTGGLADTVVDATADPREGNGFSFAEYSPDACWEAVQRALTACRDREGWRKIVRRAMLKDVSWRNAAGEYEELYRAAIEKRRG
ncbi:glycogen synthase GlgA [Geobacter pickeringii]|uniref:Glycogen synthase n=1 Tax=Geobacter pickeringii TaxID=345632 RepID=A0A0B5BD68_9BACT|nr:glycogen synthase GlgA [Geobacter pickeringii]AJE04412.1 glycogen synthase [Geobacter pickeringii]